MVAAIPATNVTAVAASRNQHPHPKNPPPPPPRNRNDPKNPNRQPLAPSEKDNAAPRRTRSEEISSRYLSSSSSTSSTSAATTLSSSTSSSRSRRFPSPLLVQRPSTPPALSQFAVPKRSHSVDRTRPLTPRADPGAGGVERSPADGGVCTTTRSLSVSFQGESFFYQTSRAKTVAPSPARKPSPERRRASVVAAASARVGDRSENYKPVDNHRLWPGARTRASNPLMRSVDCSVEQTDPILAAVRLLRQSMVLDDGARRASFDGADLSASSDTDSVSSGSNSGVPELEISPRLKDTPRGIRVPARLWQESHSRLRRSSDSVSLLSPPASTPAVQPKLGLVKKLSANTPSPLRGPVRPPSPGKYAASPSRGIASPLRARNGTTLTASPISQPANAPSIISFAAEVRRTRKGENRIEEAHMLRLLDSRYLQWRFVYAKISAALLLQKVIAEKNIYDAWITTSKLRDSVTFKKTKLQILTQNLKLAYILEGQMSNLDEWSLIDRDHLNSLEGAIEALKATTLRLPVVGAAKANMQKVKYAVGSAVEVMQVMGFTICSLLSKAERANSVISEISQVAAEERLLLDQSRDLLSTLAAMHVTQCSLQSHVIQLKPQANQMQL